jgi:hypothetical protein
MTHTQKTFLDNMTRQQAEAVLLKFRNDPELADRKSTAAYVAFCRAWQMLYPEEYWQRLDLAGGVSYNLISID